MKDESVSALCDRLMALGTPDSTRAAELLTSYAASNASLREDNLFLHTLYDEIEYKREGVNAMFEGYECDEQWRDGVLYALEFVENHLDGAPFSPDGLVND